MKIMPFEIAADASTGSPIVFVRTTANSGPAWITCVSPSSFVNRIRPSIATGDPAPSAPAPARVPS